jgi:hypothetical protein
VRPAIRRGLSPPFHELGEYPFQELCRDVLDAEPTVATCSIYGARGDHQHGIDLIAYRDAGDGIEVGQCKAYADFPPRDIRAASDEFFDYWETHWKNRQVKRFILFVASDLDSRQRQDEIDKQVERFKTCGITYEAWPAAQLRNKLRSHPSIVGTYCPPFWVADICGDATTATDPTQSVARLRAVIDLALVGQAERLAALASSAVKDNLQAMRRAWQTNGEAEPQAWVNRLKSDAPSWRSLEPTLRAEILRFEARLALDTGDSIDRAEVLADEAREEDEGREDLGLRAVITYRRSGTVAALRLLGDSSDATAIKLRLSMHLEVGDLAAAKALLQQPPMQDESDPDVHRLRALVSVAEGQLERARLAMARARELEPQWRELRLIGASIDYLSTLAPAAIPGYLVSWPVPVDWTLVRRDDSSLQRRRTSAETFRQLLSTTSEKTRREELDAWYLASIANDPEQGESAIAAARELLATNPTNFRILAWIGARRLEIDTSASEHQLNEMIQVGNATVSHVLARVNLLLVRPDPRPGEVLRILSDTKPLFEAEAQDGLSLWNLLHVRARIADGESPSRIVDSGEFSRDNAGKLALGFASAVAATRTSNTQYATSFLEADYQDTNSALSLLELCEWKARSGDWDFVADHAQPLLESIATSDAVELAATASYKAGRSLECVGILDGHVAVFPADRLLSEMRELRMRAQFELGAWEKALADATTLVQESPTVENFISLADLHYARDDFGGVRMVGRQLAGRADFTARQALYMSTMLRLEDPLLAREFWRLARDHGIPQSELGRAVQLAFELGLDHEAGPLLSQAAAGGTGDVRMVGIDEAVGILREQHERASNALAEYFKGHLPVHLAAPAFGRQLVDLYHTLPEAAEGQPFDRRPPLFIRHGGRAPAGEFLPGSVPWRLRLDTTAILLARADRTPGGGGAIARTSSDSAFAHPSAAQYARPRCASPAVSSRRGSTSSRSLAA